VALAAVDVAAVVMTNRGVVSVVHVEVGRTRTLLIVNNGEYSKRKERELEKYVPRLKTSEPLSLSLVTHTHT
jgi:hypothetical protein